MFSLGMIECCECGERYDAPLDSGFICPARNCRSYKFVEVTQEELDIEAMEDDEYQRWRREEFNDMERKAEVSANENLDPFPKDHK